MDTTFVRSRVWSWVLLTLVGWSSLGFIQSVSLAQDELERHGSLEDARRPGLDGMNTDQRKHPETLLGWMIRASGIFGFLIMLVAFVMVSIIFLIALELRRDNYLPSSFIEEFERQLQVKDYQSAYESAKLSDSFIGRVLAAGMGRLSRGYDEAVQQMQQVGDDESMSMEHKIGYLSLIGSVAPMLGLLGTVQGMVLSFQVLANSSTSPKPAELADGIAMALFTTLEGLVVAIPAMVFYSLYKNRLARFLLEAGFVADNLMRNFQGMSKPIQALSRPGGTAQMATPASPRIE